MKESLEMMIWEAKERGRKNSSLSETRRPSTTIDKSGCIVTRGFVIPSRNSSFDSVATSSTSSYETTGTPVSPVPKAPPGYSRPTGSLLNAPELRCLRGQYGNLLHTATRSVGVMDLGARPQRPMMGARRKTWQQPSGDRWSDEDLINVKCKTVNAVGVAEEKQPTPCPQSVRFARDKHHLRRSQTVRHIHRNVNATKQTNSPSDCPANLAASTATAQVTATEAETTISCDSEDDSIPSCESDGTQSSLRAETKPFKRSCVKFADETDNAIASDSDEDDEPNQALTMGGIAAIRMRPNYAARRAPSDERARAANNTKAPADENKKSNNPVTAEVVDSAIATDREEEDEPDQVGGGIAAMRRRPTYAARRALHDARARATALQEETE